MDVRVADVAEDHVVERVLAQALRDSTPAFRDCAPAGPRSRNSSFMKPRRRTVSFTSSGRAWRKRRNRSRSLSLSANQLSSGGVVGPEIDVAVFLLDQQRRARRAPASPGNAGAQERERIAVEVLDHAQAGEGRATRPRRRARRRRRRGRSRRRGCPAVSEAAEPRLPSTTPERAFAADEQIDPVHAGRKADSRRCSWWCSGRGISGTGKSTWSPRWTCEHAAIHQRDAQPENVPARAAVAEAARAAGVGGDGSADARGPLGGIGRVELAACATRLACSASSDTPAPTIGAAGRDFQPLEFFQSRSTSRLAARRRRSLRCPRRRLSRESPRESRRAECSSSSARWRARTRGRRCPGSRRRLRQLARPSRTLTLRESPA